RIRLRSRLETSRRAPASRATRRRAHTRPPLPGQSETPRLSRAPPGSGSFLRGAWERFREPVGAAITIYILSSALRSVSDQSPGGFRDLFRVGKEKVLESRGEWNRCVGGGDANQRTIEILEASFGDHGGDLRPDASRAGRFMQDDRLVGLGDRLQDR